MQVWWTAVTQDGISNDGLPFITLLLILTWLGAYISAWAIFRWRNVWLGLVPSGFALLWNISFIPGQFSYAFVIFCFGAVLLVMRVHLQQKQDDWDKEGINYPEFMSLSVLHATFWVAVVLLVLVWLVPLARRSDTAQERWEDFTSPLTQYFTPYARVFVSVNAKKPINVHNIKDALPFQGKITLTEKDAVTIDVELHARDGAVPARAVVRRVHGGGLEDQRQRRAAESWRADAGGRSHRQPARTARCPRWRSAPRRAAGSDHQRHDQGR